MFPLIQDVWEFLSICEKYKMNFYPKLSILVVAFVKKDCLHSKQLSGPAKATLHNNPSLQQ